MKITLQVIAGPHKGQEFVLDGRDTFLVGRAADCHLRIAEDDKHFSRRHFLLEVNSPRCRVIDLNSRNGVLHNRVRVSAAEVQNGDEIAVGHTVFKIVVAAAAAPDDNTIDLPTAPASEATVDLDEIPSISGYRILGELGRGSMGVVYRAQAAAGPPVALKTILPAAGISRRQVERFVRECRILSSLVHRHIVGFRDVGEDDGRLYMTMELVEGPTLADILRDRSRPDIRTVVRLTCQFLSGLAHAHASGYVHRDIKPSNLLIAQAGTKRVTKLADFGLARVYETSQVSGLTLQGEIGGTPAYMAPEQVTHYREVRPAADQYAAAATLYNLLTGRHTHDFPTDIGAKLAILVSEYPLPIAERRPDVPVGLAAVIHKALSHEPAERYPDVAAFRGELKRFA